MDLPGVRCGPPAKKLGIRGSQSCQIFLDDVRLEREHLLGEVGQGFKVAMTTLDGGRIGIAAQALGIARAAYEDARASQWLSGQAHVPAVALPFTVGGSDKTQDLFGLFDTTVALLLGAAK